MSVTPRTITQATHAPPRVAASGGAPPGGPPGTGFDLFLASETQARTAPAEGREAQTETPTGPVTQQDAPQGEETAPAQPDAVADPSAEAPATPQVSPTVDESPLVAEGQTSTTTGDAPASQTAAALEGVAAQTGVEAPVVTGGSSPKPEAVVPALEGAGATAGPAGSEIAAPAVTSEPKIAETPGATAAADGAEVPVEEQTAPAAGKGEKPDAANRPADAPGRGNGHAFGHERGAQSGGDQGQSQAAAAAAQAVANAEAANANANAAPPPVMPAATPVTTLPPTGPLLSPQVHRMQALVELAVGRGQATANLELHPAELGTVQVRLRSVTGGGLTATMTVDRPEALQGLQAAADQLRQSLEDQGVEIVRLDIGLSAQARGDEARTGARSDGRDASGGTSRRGGMDAVTDHDHDDAPVTVRPLIPGALVDVRA
ncbi:MAG: flagellar hook-length control protein FliK [Solirubrobacteraceae bacterium]|nr:flagellar hook-length control protein FliK [Solirubrobacteraceae bacterium]